jgi:hypothetical protein
MRAYRSRVTSTNTKGQVEPYADNEMMASLREAFSQPARDPWARRKTPPQEGLCLVTVPSTEPSLRDKGDSPSPRESPDQNAIADDPENLYLYVGHTGEPLVGHTGEPLSRTRFSRVPDEVLTDPRLRARDVRVYLALARAHWTDSASVGKRTLARQARCAERLVVESLKILEATGHIRKQPRKRGQRGHYVLLSPLFHEKALAPDGTLGQAVPRRQPRKEVISMPRRTVQR